MVKLLGVLIFLAVFTGCFRDPKYRRTNYYEAVTTPTIMRSVSVPSPHITTDKIFYQFFIQMLAADSQTISFKISGLSQESDPQIKLLPKLGKITYPGGQTESLTSKETFFVSTPAAVKPVHSLEPIEVQFKTPPNLNWGAKLEDDANPAIQKFEVHIPVEIKEYLFQPNGLPVFDSHGKDTFRRKQVELNFVYDWRPIPGEDKIDRRLFWQAY